MNIFPEYLVLDIIIKQINYIMGSEQSITNPCQIDPKEWIIIQQSQHIKIVKSINSGQTGKQSIIFIDSKVNIEKQLKMYQFRNINKDLGIVCILGVQLLEQKNYAFCGNQHILKVISEHMVNLWFQLPQLTLSQCIYALNQSIIGFKVCFLQQGPFFVTSKMIGINQYGHIKVWLNENFAVNHSVTQTPKTFTTVNFADDNKNEQQLIQQIIEIIEEKCQQGRFPQDLKSALQTKVKFNEVNEYLQSYINKHKIFCVDKIHPDPRKMFKFQQQSLRNKSQPIEFVPVQNIQIKNQSSIKVEPIYKTGSHFKELKYTYHPIYEQMKIQEQIQKRNTYISSNPINEFTTPHKILGTQYDQNQIQENHQSNNTGEAILQIEPFSLQLQQNKFLEQSRSQNKSLKQDVIYETGYMGSYKKINKIGHNKNQQRMVQSQVGSGFRKVPQQRRF